MMRDMKTFDPQKMLSNLNELNAELKTISEKYLNNPPKEYAADPLWKTYFEDLADNIRIVRERIERKEYRLAQKYCGQFCVTFGKMHKTNGRVTLTDMLFSLRMEVRNAQDMENAGNKQGSKAHVNTLAKLHENIQHQLAQPANAKLSQLQQSLMAAYDQWVAAVNAGDSKKAEGAFTTFMNEFPKLYGATF
jgi:TolA-binding protein